MALTKEERRLRIKRRIRKIVSGTAERPRMSVFRSNAQISVQLIDDIAGKTILAVSSLSKDIAEKKERKWNKLPMLVLLLLKKQKLPEL